MNVLIERRQSQIYLSFAERENVSIKREQCQICLDIVKREKHLSRTKRLFQMKIILS